MANIHHRMSPGASTETDRTFDPEATADRAGVDYSERTYTHEDTDHCEADAAGRVVVGVTNDAGEVLLLVDRERSVAILPNSVVGPDEEWVAVARRTVAEFVDAPVSIGDPECVRRVEHTAEDGETPHNVSHHVVFAGTIDADAPDPVVDDETDWEAGWFAELPVTVDTDVDASGDALADIQQFLV
jgi:hypothetical protein